VAHNEPTVRDRLAGLYRRPEAEVLAELAPRARLEPAARALVRAEAGRLLADLRDPGRAGWIDRFLQEYGLNTEEGVALMALA
jgi:RHH-type proline utilization regulon transcriptional repressor/proline dehydrogenase/delta 1-pyrroline-5-carboxylate dehydrogenase